MTNKNLTIGLVVVAIVAIIGVFTPQGKAVLGAVTGVTNFNSLGVSEIKVGTACNDGFTYSGCSGTTVDSTGISSILGAFSGLVTFNAGTLRSYSVSTSTAATAETMLISQLANYDTILITPTVGALTITLPATSTAATWIPSVGDMQETCFYNATGTAAATITFVAGSGIDWESVATSTIAVPSIPPALPARAHGCFKFIRTATTGAVNDISALYTVYTNAD